MTDDAMPRDFGWRYIGWLAWTNAITILSVIQGAFASALLVVDADPAHPMVPIKVVQIIVIGNAVLTGIVAQIKRNNPPPPPPMKVST